MRLGDKLGDLPTPSAGGQGESLAAKARGRPVVLALLDSSSPEITENQFRLLDRMAQTPEFQGILFVGMCASRPSLSPPLAAVVCSLDQTGGIMQSLGAGKGLPLVLTLDASLALRAIDRELTASLLSKRLCETLGLSLAGPDG